MPGGGELGISLYLLKFPRIGDRGQVRLELPPRRSLTDMPLPMPLPAKPIHASRPSDRICSLHFLVRLLMCLTFMTRSIRLLFNTFPRRLPSVVRGRGRTAPCNNMPHSCGVTYVLCADGQLDQGPVPVHRPCSDVGDIVFNTFACIAAHSNRVGIFVSNAASLC